MTSLSLCKLSIISTPICSERPSNKIHQDASVSLISEWVASFDCAIITTPIYFLFIKLRQLIVEYLTQDILIINVKAKKTKILKVKNKTEIYKYKHGGLNDIRSSFQPNWVSVVLFIIIICSYCASKPMRLIRRVKRCKV